MEEATSFEATVTPVPLPANIVRLADIIGNVKAPLLTIDCMIGAIDATAEAYDMDPTLLRMRLGLNTRTYPHFTVGYTGPEKRWCSLRAYFRHHMFRDIEINDASWSPFEHSISDLRQLRAAVAQTHGVASTCNCVPNITLQPDHRDEVFVVEPDGRVKRTRRV